MITQLSGHTVLVFVGIPALILAVLALLVFAPSIADGPRYRPGLSWWAPPVWIGGPSTDNAKPNPANLPELPAGPSTKPASAGTGVARTTGGASANW